VRRPRGKRANLTVNGPVKFALEKQTLFVLDEDGKEHEMEIVKKTNKTGTSEVRTEVPTASNVSLASLQPSS
jgi:hypothetical protein